MPITQHRMIALIHAGQDYKQAAEQLIEFAEGQLDRVLRDGVPAQTALEAFVLNAKLTLLMHNHAESEVTLTLEARHYKLNHRRNERKMTAMRERRGQYDTEPRRNAPQDLRGNTDFQSRPAAEPVPYTPKALSPEKQAEIERWSAARPPAEGTPLTALTPEAALTLEREQAQTPDFEGDLNL